MKKISLFLIGLSFVLVGCGNNQPTLNNNSSSIKKVVQKVIDPCEIEYQKCSAECKITTATEPTWKKTACEAKCKTIYGACKTKQKTLEGVNYIKEKINN